MSQQEAARRAEIYGRLIDALLPALRDDVDQESILVLINVHLEHAHESGVKDAECVVRHVADAGSGETKRVSTILADRLLDLIALNKQTSRAAYALSDDAAPVGATKEPSANA